MKMSINPWPPAVKNPDEDILASEPEDEGHGDGPEVGEREGPPEPEVRPDEDHDGVIEVDVEHGAPRYAKPGSLKREAKTLDHLLTHRYSNPYCDSCIRAKMRHFKTRKNAFKRKLSKFGDLITFDFVDMGESIGSRLERAQGIAGNPRQVHGDGARFTGARQVL